MNIARIYKRIAAAAAIAMVVMATVAAYAFVAHAAINKQINYQGKLTNSSNVAVADGLYTMEFKLYDAPTGGNTLWTETDNGSNRIQVTNGLFSVMLGSTTPFTGVDFNQTLYLGVKIESDSEMTPRKVIGAVPAAFVADTIDNISSEQFLRADAQNSTSTASTFLTFVQNGAGKIAEFFGAAGRSVLSLLSNGNVGIGTSTPYAALSVVGSSGVVADHYTATSTNATSTLTNLQVTGRFLNAPVVLVKPDGTQIPYGQSAATDAARGTAMLSAQSAASAGDTILVYANATISSPIGKDAVAWWFAPGTQITSSGTASVISDGGSPMSFSVSGSGTFISTNAYAVRLTGVGTTTIDAEKIRSNGNGNPGVYFDGVSGVVYLNVSGVIESEMYDGIWGAFNTGKTLKGFVNKINVADNAIEGWNVNVTANEMISGNEVVNMYGGESVITANYMKTTTVNKAVIAVISGNTNLVVNSKKMIGGGIVIQQDLDINGNNDIRISGTLDASSASIIPIDIQDTGVTFENFKIIAPASVAYAMYDSGGTQTVNTVGTFSTNKPIDASTISVAYQNQYFGGSYFSSNGNLGIGTTSPYAKLSVAGMGVFDGKVLASYFTATSTTASSFPYASTTALTVSGTNGLQLASGLNGSLQAVNGLVSATSTLSTAFGGTGISTKPTYGQLLLGNASGGYTLTATSSLGLTYTDSNVNAFIHASTTIPKTYTANVFTDANTFAAASTFNALATFNGSIFADVNDFSNGLVIYDTPDAETPFQIDGDSKLVLFAKENFGYKVGIGTTSPYTLLSVAGETASTYFTGSSLTATSSFPNIRFGEVVITHKDGSVTSRTATTTTDLGRGLVLLAAVASAQDGDTIQLSSGTFDIGESTLDLNGSTNVKSISLIGSGKYSTTIMGSSTNTIIRIAPRARVADFSVVAVGNDALLSSQVPIGTNESAEGALIENVYINGKSDGIFLSGLTGTTTIKNVTVDSYFDAIMSSPQAGETTVVNIYDSVIRIKDGSSTVTRGIIARGNTTVNSFNNQVYLYDTDAATRYAYVADKSNDVGGILNIYGGLASSTSGTYDLAAINTGVLNVNAATKYDPAKTTGAVAYSDNAQIRYSLGSSGASSTILWNNNGVANWVATSSLGIGFSSITGTLGVAQGGTGASSFGQGWVYSPGGTTALAASTSPTVNFIFATSTTQKSTFVAGINARNVSTFYNPSDLATLTINSYANTSLNSSDGIINIGDESVDQAMRFILTGGGQIGSSISGTDSYFAQYNGTVAIGSIPEANSKLFVYGSTFAGGNPTARLGWTDGNNLGYAGDFSADGTGSSGVYLGYYNDDPAPGEEMKYGVMSFDQNAANYFAGNVGIGTTSPYAKLSVDGRGVFNQDVRANYFTATSTTATSTFAYDLSISGMLKVLQSVTGAVVVGDTTGNARGTAALDIQSGRTTAAKVASNSNSIAVGYDNQASGLNAIALGSSNTSSGSNSVTVGISNTGSATSISTAFGRSNTATGNSSSAFGYNNTSSNTDASAFGRSNTASGNTSSAFGYSNTASATNASVFGSSITNATANSTMIGPSDSAKLTVLSTGEVKGSFFSATSTTATSTFAGGFTTGALGITAFANGNVGIGTSSPFSSFAFNGNPVPGISSSISTFSVYGGTGVINGANAGAGGGVLFSTGNATAASTGATGGDFRVLTGTGASGGTAGRGGDVSFNLGNGGNAGAAGGAGGGFSVTAGAGGSGNGPAAGVGGSVSFTAGAGGTQSISSSGANGGSITLTSGAAGSGVSGGANGGNILLLPGAGSGTGSSGKIGIGTSTPWRALSVYGSSDLGINALAGYFTATSTTASSFPYASTTALTVSGTNGLQLASGLNGSLQAVNGLVSATSTLSTAFGGTGISTKPTYGQLLLGNASGGYTLTATSSLGLLGSSSIGSGTQGQIPFYNAAGNTLTATSSLFIAQSGNVGVGNASPVNKFSVQNPGQLTVDFQDISASQGLAFYINSFSAGLSGMFASENDGLIAGFDSNIQRYRYGGGGVYVDGSSEYVGIGTNNPLSRIHALDGAVAELKFNSGSGALTPVLSLGNTDVGGKFGALVAGTNGSGFYFDDTGYFDIVAAPKADYTGNVLGFNGTGVVRVMANGNVGIGNTSPAKTLEIGGANSMAGALRLTEPVNGFFSDIFTANDDGYMVITPGGNGLVVGADLLPQSKLAVNGNQAIGSNYGILAAPTNGLIVEGNVGIGTSTPYAKLSVAGQVVAPYYTATSTTATSTFAGGVTLATGGGLVGIGTASPLAPLHMRISSLASGQELARFQGGRGQYFELHDDTIQARTTGGAVSPFYFNYEGGNTIFNGLSGSVGIGELSPNVSTKLAVSGGTVIGSGYDTLAAPTNGLIVEGNVGIGTSTPYAKLSVAGQVVAPYYTATSTTATSTFAGGVTLATGGGAVGIGTTSPGTILSIGNTGANTTNISVTSTSSLATGINLKTGCLQYAGGPCLSVSGIGTSTNPFMATYYVATSTTASSTFLGALSVNTAQSDQKLQVNGNLSFGRRAQSAVTRYVGLTDTDGRFKNVSGSGTTGMVIDQAVSGNTNIYFRTGTWGLFEDTAFTIDEALDVGVLANHRYKLGDIDGFAWIKFDDLDTQGFGLASVNLIAGSTLGNTPTTAFINGEDSLGTANVILPIDGSSLGIGQVTPTYPIDVYSSNTTAARFQGSLDSTSNWQGRLIAGGQTVAFLMGERNSQAWLGAHNAALNAWAPFYINPDGNEDLYLGSQDAGGESVQPVITIKNLSGNSGRVGIGNNTSPSAKLHVIATTEQLRLGYDASNYWSSTVGSTGATAFDAIGTGANFSFADNVGIGTSTPYSMLSVAGTVVGKNFVATSSTASILPYASSTALTVSGGLYNSALTSGRVVYSTTGGRLTDSSFMTVSGSILVLDANSSSGVLNIKNTAGSSNGGFISVNNTSSPFIAGLASGDFGFKSDFGDIAFSANNGVSANLLIKNSTGNVGIGTTSPYAKLSVVGPVAAEYFTATSTTATSTFAGGLNAAGSAGLTVLQNGKVGIGTASPSYTLDLSVNNAASDGARFSNTNGSTVITMNRSATGVNGGFRYQTAGADYWDFGLPNNGTNDLRLVDNQNSTTRLYVKRDSSGGFIGMGTTTPTAKLHIQPENAAYVPLKVTGFVGQTANLQEWQNVANTTLSVVTANGSIGIGTTSPYAKLSVVGEVVAPYYTATSTTATSTFSGGLRVAGASGLNVLQNGKIGVGTAAPVAQLQVDYNNTDYTNTGGANSHIILSNPNASGQNVISSIVNGAVVAKWRTDQVGNISWVAGTTGAHAFYTGGDYGVGTNRFNIANDGTITTGGGSTLDDTSGNITAGGDVCSNSNGHCLSELSDARLKTNVQSLGSTLDKVLQLNPVTYKWNDIYLDSHKGLMDATSTKVGFIAQDVEQLFPDLISHDRNSGYIGVDYSKFSAVLAQAIKETNSRIDLVASTTNVLTCTDVQCISPVIQSLKNRTQEISVTVAQNTQDIQDLKAQMEALRAAAASTTASVVVASTTEEIASSTKALIASDDSFIARIAAAVKDMLQVMGEWTMDKFTARIVYTERVEAQVAAISKGLEMTDAATGQIYCVQISNGDWLRRLGSCTTAASSTPVVQQAPVYTPPAVPPAIVDTGSGTTTPSGSGEPTASSTPSTGGDSSGTTGTSTPPTIGGDTAGTNPPQVNEGGSGSAGTGTPSEPSGSVNSPETTTSGGTDNSAQGSSTPTPEPSPAPAPEASPSSGGDSPAI